MQLVNTSSLYRLDRSLRTILCFVVVLMATIAVTRTTYGADLIIIPSLTIGEEYDDNIFLVPKDQTADYITHVIPAIDTKYASPFWDWLLIYSYDRRYYEETTRLNEHVQQVYLRSDMRIVKNLLFFTVADDAGRTSLSPVQDYTKQSPVAKQTDYNTFDLSPYVNLQLTSRVTLTTGYVYRNYWYSDPRALDRYLNRFYGNIAYTYTDVTTMDALIWHDKIDSARGVRTRLTTLFGPRHDYQDGSVIWGRIGPSKATYEDGHTETVLAWDAGFAHMLTSRITVSYDTGRSWIDDPLLIERREDRLVATLRAIKERTTGGLSLAVRNYGTVKYYTDERRYTTTADFSHYLTEQLQATYALAINRYERYPANAADSTTIVYLTNILLEYRATQMLTLSLSYQYTDSYSAQAQNYYDNYEVNRVFAFAKMVF